MFLRKENQNILIKFVTLFISVYLVHSFSALAQSPSANFTASPVAGCSPLLVNFQDQSLGNPVSWKWDFGNGNTSSLQNPSASYFTPGQYTVKLTVSNASGNNTLTRSQFITVYETPTVRFTANNTTGCFPLRVQFSDQSTAGSGNSNVSWFWDFGNGQTSIVQNPLVSYTSAGTFTVTLKVTNDKGCSKVLSIPNLITTTPGVRSVFTNTLANVCSPPADITFTNSSTGPGLLSWFWDFGDGNTSTQQNPLHTYNTSGNYTVTLATTSSSGCSDTARSAVPLAIGGISTLFNSPDTICANSVVNFTNTSVPAPVSSNWNFGDGGTSTLINPTHTYLSAGTYSIRLYNRYSNCLDSVQKNIVVNPLPIPDFSAPATISCQPPFTVNFQDLSSSGTVSWLWDFGDSSTSTQQNPVHTYTNYGSYNVTLVVTNSFGCTDTIIKNNFIEIRRATIRIPSLPTHGCIPFTISPVANITALDLVTSYLWDFGDGATSNSATPTHTYTVQGTYNVSLIITTSTGCTDTLLINNAVRVGTNPFVDFTATPTTICALQAVQFSDLSTPADQWQWSFGDGATSTTRNPRHVYDLPGNYTVTLVASNNGCPGTMVKSNFITVLPPVARFNFTASCPIRTQFTFTDQSIGPVSWLWDFGDGSPTSSLQNPVHNFPALGVYTVSLTVTNGSCSNTLRRTVFAIDESPDFISPVTTGCKPFAATFSTTNVTPNYIASHIWEFGDGASAINSLSGVINHTYTSSGTYTVRLITVDINGCRDTAIKTNYVRVNGPRTNFSATNASGCIGLTTIFNDLSTTDGVNNIVSWQWDFGDSTIQTFNSPPFQHTYTTPDTFSVKLKITDAAGCTDSMTRTNLVVATAPKAIFTSRDTLTCPGASVSFQNVSQSTLPVNSFWDFGDGTTVNTIGLAPVSHIYSLPGDYTVTLKITDPAGCSDSLSKNLYVHVEYPSASFTVSDTMSSCIPLEAHFTNTSTYYSSLYWDFNPGNSSLANPVHYYSLPGTYTATLIATSRGNCKDTAYQTITVFDTTGAYIDYSAAGGCNPLTVDFAAYVSGSYDFLWDFGDGTFLATSSPSARHVYTTFGNFLPRVILTDPTGCLIPVSGIDTIHIIGANAKFGLDKNLLCDSGIINFTDSTTFNDPVISYNWTFGDGGSSSVQNPVHQYNSPGNYTVTLTVQTQSGCSDIATMTNAVKVVQSPSIAITGDTSACVFSPLLQSGVFNFPDTSVVTWQWSFPNGTNSNLQNPPAQTYIKDGNFIVSAIATNSSGCKDTALQNITIYPLPTVNMPGTMTIQNGFPAIIPATYSSNTINWSWMPSLGLSCVDCPQPVASPKFNTDYTVSFIDSNGCINSGLIHIIVICKNANLFMPNTFSPNGDGSNDVFYPRGKGLDRVKTLRIFDRWGEVVFEQNNFPVNNALYGWDGTFKGKKPQAGVYIYQVEVYCDNGDIIKLGGNVALIL